MRKKKHHRDAPKPNVSSFENSMAYLGTFTGESVDFEVENEPSESEGTSGVAPVDFPGLRDSKVARARTGSGEFAAISGGVVGGGASGAGVGTSKLKESMLNSSNSRHSNAPTSSSAFFMTNVQSSILWEGDDEDEDAFSDEMDSAMGMEMGNTSTIHTSTTRTFHDDADDTQSSFALFNSRHSTSERAKSLLGSGSLCSASSVSSSGSALVGLAASAPETTPDAGDHNGEEDEGAVDKSEYEDNHAAGKGETSTAALTPSVGDLGYGYTEKEMVKVRINNDPTPIDLGYGDPDDTAAAAPSRIQHEPTYEDLGYGDPDAPGDATDHDPTYEDLGYGDPDAPAGPDPSYADLGYGDPDVEAARRRRGPKKSNPGYEDSDGIPGKQTLNYDLGYEDPSASARGDHSLTSSFNNLGYQDFGSRNKKEPANDGTEGVDDETSFTDDHDDDISIDPLKDASVDSTTGKKIKKCMGLQLPSCCSCIPSCSRIANCVVHSAPCFWCCLCCCRSRTNVMTDRLVLTRLNILCALSTFVPMGSAIALFTVMVLPNVDKMDTPDTIKADGLTPNFWSMNSIIFCAGLLGLGLFLATMISINTIQIVNLVGAIRYMWVMLWVIPAQAFLVFSLYDYHNVTKIWVTHWWYTPALAWFREIFCERGTAEKECLVPKMNVTEEQEWCSQYYNVTDPTDCTRIRDDAQDNMSLYLHLFYHGNAFWGLLIVILLLLIVSTLERIISRPIVQKSRETNVPAWLIIPILGCANIGGVFRFSPSSLISSSTNNAWIGTAYLICSALFLLASGLGWFISAWSILSSRDKRYKHVSLLLFMLLIIVIIIILTFIFGLSLSYSFNVYKFSLDNDRGTLACAADGAESCSNCDLSEPDSPICPQWTLKEVTSVLQAQSKQSAVVSGIFLIYAIGALRFGFLLRKHLAMYQIDYV